MRYVQYYNGEWIAPRRRAQYLKCCDCGVVHRFDFRLVKRGPGREIQFRATRLRRRGKRPPCR